MTSTVLYGWDNLVFRKSKDRVGGVSADVEPKISVSTNVPFKLKVIYGNDKEKAIDVTPQTTSC